MEQLTQAIENFTQSQLIPLAVPIAIAAITIVGLGFLIGWQRVIDWCKGHILHILLGLALIYLGTNLIQSYVTSLGF